MNFFIFSLPRSGSAWLSVFLTGKDSFCYHELTVEKDWQNAPKARVESVIGAVDTAASMYSNLIYDAFPNAKYFTLVRDRNEINKSIKKLDAQFNLNPTYDAFNFDLPSHSEIRYDLLTDLCYLEDVWSRVIGSGFDKERAKILTQMNIQRDVKKFIADLKAA